MGVAMTMEDCSNEEPKEGISRADLLSADVADANVGFGVTVRVTSNSKVLGKDRAPYSSKTIETTVTIRTIERP